MGAAGHATHPEPWNEGKIVGQKAPFLEFLTRVLTWTSTLSEVNVRQAATVRTWPTTDDEGLLAEHQLRPASAVKLQKTKPASEKRAEEDERRVSHTVREVYRKLASELHPDRVAADTPAT